MLTLIGNLRLAVRDLRHRPTFSATVVLTLAIGIGATTAAFALVNAVFLTPLPVRNQNALVEMRATDPARGFPRYPVVWDVPRLLLEHRHSFLAVSAFRANDPYPFAARDGAHTVHIAATGVDGNFFDVLGVRPSLGRLLQPKDDVPDGPDVVVLSDRVWHRDYSADPHVIGRLLFFAGGAHRVIGIAAPEFSYPSGTDAWTPVTREIHRQNVGSPNDALTKWGFFLVGRLRAGATRWAARTDLDAALRTDSASGMFTADWGALPTAGVVDRYADVVLGGQLRPAVLILFGAVALVLVIACANVAGLLLARGISRSTELAVRSALGARRGQLLVYLLSECAVLGACGGLLGLGTASVLVRAAVAFAPPGLPMIATAHLDPVVLAFALITTAASVAGFGIAPALRGARSAPYGIHHFGARSMTLTPLATMTRRALVAAQVALAVVILSGAGVLSHTLVGLQQVPLGFTPDHLLFFRLDWMLPSLPVSPSVFMTRWHGFIDRLAQVSPATPGLGPITTTLVVPFGGAAAQTQYTLDGRIPAAGRPFELTDIDYALPDYFAVMGIPLRGGRTFDVHDNDAHGPPVIIVNESFAHQAWPNQDPLGHRLRFRADTAGRWFTVVGVVGDARYADLAAPPHPTVYQSPGQGIEGDPWLAVRTRGDPAQADSLLEHVIEGADPAFGISRTTTGPELLSTRLARPRALATLFGGLAGTALLLAALGLFGVLSAYVRERRREIAIRSALGATPTRLRALVVGQAIGVAAAGIACGLPLALASSHVLRAMVSEVRPVDALTAVAVVVVLLMVVVLATYGPMVRASRADPRIALASE